MGDREADCSLQGGIIMASPPLDLPKRETEAHTCVGFPCRALRKAKLFLGLEKRSAGEKDSPVDPQCQRQGAAMHQLMVCGCWGRTLRRGLSLLSGFLYVGQSGQKERLLIVTDTAVSRECLPGPLRQGEPTFQGSTEQQPVHRSPGPQSKRFASRLHCGPPHACASEWPAGSGRGSEPGRAARRAAGARCSLQGESALLPLDSRP